MQYIVGHKNPDTDSVCAAIALTDLFTKQGMVCKACINGEPSPETSFVLEKFRLTKPETLSDGSGKEVFLVDHSDVSQSLDNIENAKINGIVDHHKLGDVTTNNPPEAWIWPVGSTCTVIKNMFDFYNQKIERGVAGAMVSAILSDTVIFKSATSTKKDEEAAKELAGIAGVSDITAFGIELFKVKSAIEDSTPQELLQRDYKDFDMNGCKVGISQLELIDVGLVENIKKELFEELKKLKSEGRHTVLLLLTDIMKEGSEFLIVSDDESIVEKAFDVKVEDNHAWLEGIMSRKKQVVPPLEEVFSA
ncbi:MAG: manganese-dependent inorganic pyrophosphatase [Nanoarchaeota archaeon]